MLTDSVYARDIRVRRYAEYLAADGHFIDIICLQSEDRTSQGSHMHIRVFPLPWMRNRREGLGLVLNWLTTAFFMLLRGSWLDIEDHYDVVHVHNMPDFLVFCAIVPRLRGCPILLNIHDPVPELAQSKLQLSAEHPLIRIQALLETLSTRFSSHIITSTDFFRQKLVERGIPREKITVIANAPEPGIFLCPNHRWKRRTDQKEFVLLYVGTVAYRYGLHILVEALPRLREEIPTVRVRVYTKILKEGKTLDQCVLLARRLGVADLFEVRPPAPLDRMPEIMSQADLGVYPALRDVHMDNALSLKIPEMAAVGLPIVATRLSVLEEIYGDDSIAFVPSGDPDALARKIIQLYQAPEMLDRLSASAFAKSRVLDWKSEYRVYQEILKSLLGRNIA